MKICTAISTASNPTQVVAELIDGLQLEMLGRPDFVTVHFEASLSAEGIFQAARGMSGALHGGTSCRGVMTQQGVILNRGAGAAAFAIWDSDGSYGTHSLSLGTDAFAAARQATIVALQAAGRPGEIPELVWLTVAPGREEQVLDGIRSVIGTATIIVGGSSADSDLSGSWAQFGPGGCYSDGVVVSVLFPSVPATASYQCGYAPTGQSGIVTRVNGRRLYEIDDLPAAEVYNRWTFGALPLATEASASVLDAATLWPFGRVVSQAVGIPYYLLALPFSVHSDGAIDLFAELNVGDRIWQMHGSVDGVTRRTQRTAAQLCRESEGEIRGALVVCCGGSMVAVGDRIAEMQSELCSTLGDVPWLSVFSFGVQGMSPGEPPRHGNLQVLCTVFGD